MEDRLQQSVAPRLAGRIGIMTDTAPPAQRLDDNAIAASLLRMGLIGRGERPFCRPLEGGFSSEIWLIELPGRRLCVKRALPRLKVAQLWEAPVARNHYEYAWFGTAARICPDAVPPLLGEDAEAGLFAMEYLDPARYPLWKSQLRDGHADPATAAAGGARLPPNHHAPAGDRENAHTIAAQEKFPSIPPPPQSTARCRSNTPRPGPTRRGCDGSPARCSPSRSNASARFARPGRRSSAYDRYDDHRRPRPAGLGFARAADRRGRAASRRWRLRPRERAGRRVDRFGRGDRIARRRRQARRPRRAACRCRDQWRDRRRADRAGRRRPGRDRPVSDRARRH